MIQESSSNNHRNTTKTLIFFSHSAEFTFLIYLFTTCLQCETNMATKKMIPVPYPFSMEEELKKNSELKISDIEMLREWCEKQQHLPKPSDLHLIMFLHSNYYSIEAAKNTIENFFTIRSHVPEFFANRDPLGSKELRQIFNVV